MGRGNALSASRRRAWSIVLLLACIQGINQADKAVVGLAAEQIMAELQLTAAQFGLVAGALYATFSLGGIAVAFLAAPRFAPRWIMTVMLAMWSIALMPVVFFASLPVLIGSRLVLGASEGGGTPTALNMVHDWFPDDKRDFPASIVIVGGTVGALIAAPGLTWCIAQYGWRSAFLVCALVGACFLAGWLAVGRDGPFGHLRDGSYGLGRQPQSALRTNVLSLLGNRQVLANICMGFCAYWVVGFTVGWLPAYLRDMAGVSLKQSGWMIALVFLGQGGLVLLSALATRILAQDNPDRARSIVQALCMLGGGAGFFALAALQVEESIPLLIVLLILATGLPIGVFSPIAATLGKLGEGHKNALVTVVISAITLAGLVSPPAIGALIDPQHVSGWHPALILTACVCLIGALPAFAAGIKRARVRP